MSFIFVPPMLCGVLLLGMVGEARRRVNPASTEPYHARAKAAVEAIPQVIGSWTGLDEKVPDAAIQLLRYPTILSRKYQDTSPGLMQRDRWAQVLVVQCRDTRDLYGHYPPKCYPNSGEDLVFWKDHTWTINGVVIKGREYHFSKMADTRTNRKCVYNFLIVPGKGIVPDMETLAKAAEDYQQRYYGAAQVQILMSAELPEDQREDIFKTLVGALTDCVRILESGGLKP